MQAVVRSSYLGLVYAEAVQLIKFFLWSEKAEAPLDLGRAFEIASLPVFRWTRGPLLFPRSQQNPAEGPSSEEAPVRFGFLNFPLEILDHTLCPIHATNTY
jgi:hypothetical protein